MTASAGNRTIIRSPSRATNGAAHHPIGSQMIRALLVGFIVFLVATFPATWLLMLFLGNVHLDISYWGTLPLGILVSALLGGATSVFIPE
jgi:hypothetical protein